MIIDDTFAEAFPMKATRLLITAHDPVWARHAAVAATGFATSVIACGCEAGIERELHPDETPDGRPGLAVLIFAMSGKELARQVERRVGQCVLTCPTTAVYAGLPADAGEPIALGRGLRFFGDGGQIGKRIAGRRLWRVPVMDGEFVADETTPVVKGVGGGNLLLLARDTDAALRAAQRAAEAMRAVPGVILPFPGGVVRSGSKVGSRYPALMASTNDAFCPTQLGLVPRSELDAGIGSVLEIVVDGLSAAAVARSMQAGLDAVRPLATDDAAGGLLRVSAGNYGGKLGPFHFHLHRLHEHRPVEATAATAASSSAAAEAPTGHGWRLTLRRRPALRLELDGLLPETLDGLDAAAVAALPLRLGRLRPPLSDWFDVAPAGVAGELVLVFPDAADGARLDRIGAGMTRGRLVVHGDAGDEVGAGMSGGRIEVHGSVRDQAGVEMQGGALHIAGDAGDFVASARPGSLDGMRGGLLSIAGRAGARLADRMRRGTLLVAGGAGDFALSRLVAGTVLVGGPVGVHPAWGLRRGSVVLLDAGAQAAAQREPGLVPGGGDVRVAWTLIARDLRRQIEAVPEAAGRAAFRPMSDRLDDRVPPPRLRGDLAVDGLGELFLLPPVSDPEEPVR